MSKRLPLSFPVLDRQHFWQRSVYAAALGFMQAASVTEGCAGAPCVQQQLGGVCHCVT